MSTLSTPSTRRRASTPLVTQAQAAALSDEALQEQIHHISAMAYTASQMLNARGFGRCQRALDYVLWPELHRRRALKGSA